MSYTVLNNIFQFIRYDIYLLQTISLPIVVTTGASQSCNVHGSLLWQCFSTKDAVSVTCILVCSVLLSRFNGQHNNHQIYLKFYRFFFLAIKLLFCNFLYII